MSVFTVIVRITECISSKIPFQKQSQRLEPVFAPFPCRCFKIPGNSSSRMIPLASRLKVWGFLWWRKNAAWEWVVIASTVTKQRGELFLALSSLFIQLGIPAYAMVPPMHRVGLPAEVNICRNNTDNSKMSLLSILNVVRWAVRLQITANWRRTWRQSPQVSISAWLFTL